MSRMIMLATFAFAVDLSDTANAAPITLNADDAVTFNWDFTQGVSPAPPYDVLFANFNFGSVDGARRAGGSRSSSTRRRSAGSFAILVCPPRCRRRDPRARRPNGRTPASQSGISTPERRLASRCVGRTVSTRPEGPLSGRRVSFTRAESLTRRSARVFLCAVPRGVGTFVRRGQVRITGIQLTREARRGRETPFIPPIVSRSSR
jgi:hypothetical protein